MSNNVDPGVVKPIEEYDPNGALPLMHITEVFSTNVQIRTLIGIAKVVVAREKVVHGSTGHSLYVTALSVDLYLEPEKNISGVMILNRSDRFSNHDEITIAVKESLGQKIIDSL